MLNSKQIKRIKSECEIIRSQKVLISAYGTLDRSGAGASWSEAGREFQAKAEVCYREAAEALAIAASIAGRSDEIVQWIRENPHMAGRGHKV